MVSAQETVFWWIPVQQLTIVVSSVAFFYHLLANNRPLVGCQWVGSKESPYLCMGHLLAKQSPIFLPIYLYIGPTSDTEWVTKVKPDMNSVEIHQQLSHQGLDSTPMRKFTWLQIKLKCTFVYGDQYDVGCNFANCSHLALVVCMLLVFLYARTEEDRQRCNNHSLSIMHTLT